MVDIRQAERGQGGVMGHDRCAEMAATAVILPSWRGSSCSTTGLQSRISNVPLRASSGAPLLPGDRQRDGQTAEDERRKRKGKRTGPYRLSGMDGLPNSRVLQKIRNCPSDRFLGLAPLGRLPASAFDLPPQSWHSPGILQTGRPTDGTDRDKSVGRQGRDAQNCSCKLAAPLRNHCSGSHPRRSPEPLPSDAPSLLLLPSPSLLLLSHRNPPPICNHDCQEWHAEWRHPGCGQRCTE